jgi:hypothetical protein
METVTVKQIHRAFDREADTLLVVPEDNFPKKEALKEKTERLKKLGFSRCSEVGALERFDQDREDYLKRLEEQQTANGFAQKYRTKYPDLKFIVEKQLDKICRKYNLVTKPVSEYAGDIPEQKLFEMEYWLDEIEDADIPDYEFEYTLTVYDDDRDLKIERDWKLREESRARGFLESVLLYPFNNYSKSFGYSYKGKIPLSDSDLIKAFVKEGVPKEDIIMSNIQMSKSSISGLVIAAPASMFRKPEKNLDPIVLQPVIGGYLVIAKWGDEANDPELVVPELN